jgi:large subunit ribosomal protein L21
MYAVILAGSRQFKVTEGQTLTIDRVPGNAGDKYTFSQVLLVGGDAGTKIGAPTLAGATVEATIKTQGKGEKVTIFKYKRRKNYKRTTGHRQPITVLEIGKIKA